MQLLQTDDQATIIDKINFNYDQILALGGGPPGPTGIRGIQGVPGQQGIQGFTGSSGADGAYWFVQPSSVNPSLPTPKEGDLWYQTDNNNVLQYTGSPLAWTVVGNLTAPAQAGVVRSNGNIYVSGDEDGGGPNIDGDTILAYDSVKNEVRGDVRINGDIITGITSPPGWIKVPITSAMVTSAPVGGGAAAGNLASASNAIISYKIIGKTVYLTFFIQRFNNGNGSPATFINIALPSALQNVSTLFAQGLLNPKGDWGGYGSGHYEQTVSPVYFPIEVLLINSSDATIVGSLAGQWVLSCIPHKKSPSTPPDQFLAGNEHIRGTIMFEIL